MKRLSIFILLVCAFVTTRAQTNLVKNPDFERYSKCPNWINRINYCDYWSIPGDSTTDLEYNSEYYNVCGNVYLDKSAHIPENTRFFQQPHSGLGMCGGHLFFDKTGTPPPGYPFIPFNFRDYFVGRLHAPLTAGKVYCVSFWICLAEDSYYAHNKIGAYLDNGTIHSIPDTFEQEITSVIPQVYTNKILDDTAKWVKLEGSFTAGGGEHTITIGNFAPNDSVSTIIANWMGTSRVSYYLVDDVSVVPLDWNPNAGADTWVEVGKQVGIGDTTAEGMDSKWYHKGLLIDSGGVISVNAAATTGALDTYVVVQTVCGMVKSDTVVVRTVPVGMKEYALNKTFIIYPSPSNGSFTISTNVILSGGQRSEGSVNAAVYDLLGRKIDNQPLHFSNNQAIIHTKVPDGFYIFELTDDAGNTYRERLEIRN